MIKERIAKLISVKSIITILMSVLVMILALKGIISGEMVMTVYTMIIGFYFGTQSKKETGNNAADISEVTD